MQKAYSSHYDTQGYPGGYGFPATNGYGYHPDRTGAGMPPYGITPAVSQGQGTGGDQYRNQCLMQGSAPMSQMPGAGHPNGTGPLDYTNQMPPYSNGCMQGSGGMPPLQGGLPPVHNPQGMGGKGLPQEIYPWMRENRHNGKQRAQQPPPTAPPGKIK